MASSGQKGHQLQKKIDVLAVLWTSFKRTNFIFLLNLQLFFQFRPIAAVPFDSSTPIHSAPGNGNFESAEIDSLVQRYLASAQYKTALFWADKRLALCRKNGSQPSFVDMAEFVKVCGCSTV